MAELHENPDGTHSITGGLDTRKKKDRELLANIARKSFGIPAREKTVEEQVVEKMKN